MIGIYYLTTYSVQVKNINNHMLIQSEESYEISTKQTYSTSIKYHSPKYTIGWTGQEIYTSMLFEVARCN